jgi:hypothetical protein
MSAFHNRFSMMQLPLSRTVAATTARAVVSPPYPVVSPTRLQQLFDSEYLPGTFGLAERKRSPTFLADEGDPPYEERSPRPLRCPTRPRPRKAS